MVTAVSIVDGRTHYFKSDDERPRKKGPPDAGVSVLEAVSRSGLSAPYYFDPVDDPRGGHVWIDGGSFTENCPAEECLIEALRRKWDKDEVRILSIGTGHSDPRRSYSRAANRESWKTIGDYVNTARQRCVPRQFERFRQGWKRLLPTVKVKRVDMAVPEKINILDGARYAREYGEIGKKLAEANVASTIRFLEV